jgi:hypothetical protein
LNLLTVRISQRGARGGGNAKLGAFCTYCWKWVEVWRWEQKEVKNASIEKVELEARAIK